MSTRRNVLFWLIVLSVAIPCAAIAEAGSQTFGTKPSADLELTPIGEIVSDPDAWEGRRVRVAGEVSGVCSVKGCWIDLTAADDATLRIKVDDGVIVFPSDAVGRQAEAEGEVEILEMERDEYEGWLRHLADEEGREFDPSSVGQPPYRIVRLRTAGATIAGP